MTSWGEETGAQRGDSATHRARNQAAHFASSPKEFHKFRAYFVIELYINLFLTSSISTHLLNMLYEKRSGKILGNSTGNQSLHFFRSFTALLHSSVKQ